MSKGYGSTFLITGGAGFLGFNLTKALLSRNDRVICLDNLKSGQVRNLQFFQQNSSFKFIEHDVRSPYPESLSRFQIDGVYNLACPASPPWYQADPIGTLTTSVLGALNGLNYSQNLEIPFIQASTSEVYGDPLQNPQIETYWGNVNSIGPRACYDEGKRAAETLCMDFARQGHSLIGIVRIFNTYGIGMRSDDGRVVSNFINAAITNQPIPVHGDGTQTRSFCFVDDLILGLILMMDFTQNRNSDELPSPINLGNPDTISMLDLARRIISITNSESELHFLNRPQDDPNLRMPNIERAMKTLGWQPQISLQEGLEKTVHYFRGEKK